MITKLCKPPTSLQELQFVDNIYRSRDELKEVLAEKGYSFYTEISVPSVDCFLYVPIAFPLTHEEEASFDFGSFAGGRLSVGVCIGGTRLTNGWDEKWKLGVQGILKLNHNCSCADKAATKIFMALDDFVSEHRVLSTHDIKLDVHVSGYSLGGLFAQVTTVLLQDWANTTRSEVSCRTYESPGVPEMYHEIAKNYDEDAVSYWNRRIVNYKSLPNPLNTVFKDLGRVYHLKNIENVSCDRSWVIKCLAGTTKRLVFWGSLLKGFGISSGSEDAFSSFSKLDQRLIIGASIALSLGMDLREIVHNHDVTLMAKSFDKKTGTIRQEVCLEMHEWPTYQNFQETAENVFRVMSQNLVLMDPRNAGVHTLFLFGGKRGFVERKLSSMPGYLPKVDICSVKLEDFDDILTETESEADEELEEEEEEEELEEEEEEEECCLSPLF